MNPQERENLRRAILQTLDANNTRFGLTLDAIGMRVSFEFGFRGVGKDNVEAELTYLEDKGLIAPVQKTLSPEIRCWRIAAAGRDFLAL